jgi:hypothetical protein
MVSHAECGCSLLHQNHERHRVSDRVLRQTTAVHNHSTTMHQSPKNAFIYVQRSSDSSKKKWLPPSQRPKNRWEGAFKVRYYKDPRKEFLPEHQIRVARSNVCYVPAGHRRSLINNTLVLPTSKAIPVTKLNFCRIYSLKSSWMKFFGSHIASLILQVA